MTMLSLSLCLVFVVGAWSCSLPPGTPFYSNTQRSILASHVIYGTVLNISTSTRENVFYKACVQVHEVIKGKKNMAKIMCFGSFGPDYLCLTNVYERTEYIFFLDKDFKAKYDGFPLAAVIANPQTLEMARRGVCDPYATVPPSSCVLPRIEAGSLSSILRVKEGQTLIIPCRARSGTQPVIIKWIKRGRSNPLSTLGNSLQLFDVTVSDMGTYVCTIQNPAGQASKLVRVAVDPEPCGAMVALNHNENTTIQSPKYPQRYPGDKMCSWRICPSQGQRVGLDFKAFNLLFEDSVEIYHECDPNGGGKLKYCSNTSPGKLVSRCTSSCIQFWFISTQRRNYDATGFLLDVFSTNEGSTIYDYGKLYCDNPILIRFIPKTVYSSYAEGKVLFNYKQTGPSKGQDIRISLRIKSRADLFGCFNEMQENMEYYVGAFRSPSNENFMKFFMLTDSKKKPPMFDKYLNDYKNAPPACRPSSSSSPRPIT